jgi:hypothetical protein
VIDIETLSLLDVAVASGQCSGRADESACRIASLRVLGEAGLAAFEIFEEAVDLVFSVEGGQAVIEGFRFEDQVVCGVSGFLSLDGGAQTVEGYGGLVGGGDGAGGVGFAYGASAAVLGNEHLTGGAGLLQLLLEAVEGVAEGFGLASLIFELLGEALH